MNREMTRDEAIDAILAMNDAGEMNTAVWSAMGWPFEGFLRFVHIEGSQANANLSKVQAQMRAQRESG